MVDEFRPIILNWRLTEASGWGLVGVHTVLHLLRTGKPFLLLEQPDLNSMKPEVRAVIAGLVDRTRDFAAMVAGMPTKPVMVEQATVLYALNSQMEPPLAGQAVMGARNIGVGAFTDTLFDDQMRACARSYDRLIVHSTFNQTVLSDNGLPGSVCVFQGVDPAEVSPGPKTGLFPGRYVVFSGGKLEFRKGQDIVIAAFRAFQQRHPEALLLTNWINFWPGLALGMAESPVLPTSPRLREDGTVDIAGWMRENGLPEGSFMDLGYVARTQLAPIMRDCDLAVFPNRCEPGTNLVAMEAMACGVPTVLSGNTGHLDIAAPGRCYTLTRQRPVTDPNHRRAYWGESDVEELLEAMEFAYQNRSDATSRGLAAAAWILGERSWPMFAERFINAATA